MSPFAPCGAPCPRTGLQQVRTPGRSEGRRGQGGGCGGHVGTPALCSDSRAPGTAAGSAATRSQRASGFREDCGSAPVGPGYPAWCASRLCSPPSGTGGAEGSPGQRITRSGQISLGRRQRLSQFEVRALPLPHPMHFNSRDTVPSKSTLSRFEQLHSAEMA